MSVGRTLASVVAVAAVVVACGSDDSSTTGTDAAPTTGTTVTARADVFENGLVDCERLGALTPLDAETAREYIPDDQELFINETGGANFVLQFLNCNDLITDGQSHGPGYFATAWIAIVGPEQAPTLPAETDLVAEESDYFYPVLFQSDNESFQEAHASFGIPMTLTDEVSFDPTAEGTQTGSATDTNYDPALAYEWTVENVNPSEGGMEAVHTVLGTDDEGMALTYYGEFRHSPGWLGNLARVDIEPGTWLEGLLGTGYVGMGNGTNLDIEMVVFRSSSS